MDGPGMSLFQGAASIHINNTAQDRLEEQEELEDEKRRNEELKHKLANAFDDLADDDDASSVNSSGNFTLDPLQINGGQHNTRPGKPPTYIESLNHLKEAQQGSNSPKPICETPKHTSPLLRSQEEVMGLAYSPYGAGDGQNHYYAQGHLNGINNVEARQEYMNNEQLKVMYEMRVTECQQLAAQREKLDSEIESLRARLAASLNDKDKAELSLQEAHHLLASSKHKMIELEQQVTAVTEKLMSSEQDKEQLRLELRSANITLQDVQQRLHTMQVAHTHDTDALFREQQVRFREETDRLQSDVMKFKTRLEEKENEIKQLEKRCKEKEREKEEILIEKGTTINRLAEELEAAQNRLVGCETTKLKEKLSQVTIERNSAREQVKELGSKLEKTAYDLVFCRNKLSASQKEYDTWRTTLHQILQESLPENTYIGEPPSPGKLSTLKEVLNRYKLQMQKVSTLQEELAKRDKKLEQHRKQESELRSKIEEQRGVEMQLNSRLAVLQNKLELLSANSDSELIENYKLQNERLQTELEDTKAEIKNLDLKFTELELEHDKLKSEKGSRASIVQEANADLLRELERCSCQLKDTLRENGELKTLYLQACSSRDTVSRELKDIQARNQKEKELYKSQEKEYVERLEKERQQAAKVTSELNSCKNELERANKRISELQKEFTDKQREFTDKLDKYLQDEKTAMRKEMEPCAQCEKNIKHVRYLEEQLSKASVRSASQESNEALMKELKGKAEFFQQYIMDRFKRLQEQRSVATNTDDAPTRADSIEDLVQTCDDHMAAKTALMMKEKAIRDQIAEKFTLEMKTVEMNCARRIKEMENEHINAVTKLKELLERKAKEVDTLKEFIMSERSKVTQILESKENEISELIKEHNELQTECQKAKDSLLEYKHKYDKYREKISKINSPEEQLKKYKEEQHFGTKEVQTLQSQVDKLQTKVSLYENKYPKLQQELRTLHQQYRTLLQEFQTMQQEYKNLQREYQTMKRDHQCMQQENLNLQQAYQSMQQDCRTLQEKYKNVKKTVFTYKDYIEKKDVHVNNEVNRIQDEYKKIFVKYQNQINYYKDLRAQDERSRSQQEQYDYTEKINKLSEDFSRLTQSSSKNGINGHKDNGK